MKTNDLKKAILSGKIFIYPTDTIYGIGCNALSKKAVEKLKEIKKRDNKPLSIIAPSFKWIKENCIISINLKKYLPGPYTIILKKKTKKFLPHVSNTDSLGIRIPEHPLIKKIQKAGVPFITTSVNLAGQSAARKISEIPKQILTKVDIVLGGGKLNGRPSALIINGKVIKR